VIFSPFCRQRWDRFIDSCGGCCDRKDLSKKNEYKMNNDKEILGWGAGNFVTGFFSGFPVDGSFSVLQ